MSTQATIYTSIQYSMKEQSVSTQSDSGRRHGHSQAVAAKLHGHRQLVEQHSRFGSDKLYIVSAINASIVPSVFVVK